MCEPFEASDATDSQMRGNRPGVSAARKGPRMSNRVWKRTAAVLVITAAAVAAAAIVAQSPAAGAAGPRARATLRDTSGQVVGEVVFRGRGEHTDQVVVELEAPAAPGLGAFHGIHAHSVGSCDPNPSGSTNAPFGSAGGHWNPTGANHGSHSGDLPSVYLNLDGRTRATFESDRVDVAALVDASGDGSAVVLHVGPDNFANIPDVYGPPNAATLATGDAGGRYACGVIRAAR